MQLKEGGAAHLRAGAGSSEGPPGPLWLPTQPQSLVEKEGDKEEGPRSWAGCGWGSTSQGLGCPT